MTAGSIVCDTSPMIALAQSGRLALLRQIFAEILVPPAGVGEIRPSLPAPPSRLVQRALCRPMPAVVVAAALDPGETAVIALEHPGAAVVLAELAARHLARGLGIPVTGTLGILLLATRRGVPATVRPEIESLIDFGCSAGSKIIQALLLAAGEDAPSPDIARA